MKQLFITKTGSSRLLLFFAGWGMDETPFLHLPPAGCDRMICYDYRSPEFDVELLRPYTHIAVVGWSMGVWAASQVMASAAKITQDVQCSLQLPVKRSIAINGTPFPIDETRGIAPAVFDGTLAGLNEQTLRKFQRRMCASAADYNAFLTVAPRRSVDELRDELAAIREQVFALPPSPFAWQRAIIGTGDRIFLPENQRRAWEGTDTEVKEIDAAHYFKI